MDSKDKYLDLIKKDRELKAAQMELQKEIAEFIGQETGINGQATLLDVAFALMMKYQQKPEAPKIES